MHLKRRLYLFQLKGGISISDHIKNYMKLLANFTNLDVVIEDEDKALILLSSLSDKRYETFVLTLINGRTFLIYSEVTAALVNLELRKNDKECVGCSKITEYKSSESRVQTPDARLIIATSAAPRCEG